MLQADYFIGVGAILAGIGIIIVFQGLGFLRSNKTVGIGKAAYGFGMFWAILGFTIMMWWTALRFSPTPGITI